jgi:hypothetical protein
MSTPKSQTKKTASKPVEPKPKYRNEQLLFFIDYGRNKSGRVLQSKVSSWTSVNFNLTDSAGKKIGSVTKFQYEILTADGYFEDVNEDFLYPTLQSVSLAFTQNFTTLLK